MLAGLLVDVHAHVHNWKHNSMLDACNLNTPPQAYCIALLKVCALMVCSCLVLLSQLPCFQFLSIQ